MNDNQLKNSNVNGGRINENNIFSVVKNTNLSVLNVKNSLYNADNYSDEFNLLKTADDFRIFHLMSVKKYNFNGSIYGLVHVQLKYFKKMSNYDYYMNIVKKKTEQAVEISKKHSCIDKVFVLLDLSNITQRNFSKKFIKIFANDMNDRYDNQLAVCYITGNLSFVKGMWPFILMFLEKETKEKLMLLK